MTAAWLTDNRDLDLLEYDAGLLRRAGLTAEKRRPGAHGFGRRPGAAVGRGGARDLRRRRGRHRAADLHGTTVGSGFVGSYETHLSIGTTGWIGCPLPGKKTDVIRQLAAIPGLGAWAEAPYVLGNNQETAGRCLEGSATPWPRGVTGVKPTYEDILACAATAPPGRTACCSRRGWRASAAQSTTGRREPGSTTCR